MKRAIIGNYARKPAVCQETAGCGRMVLQGVALRFRREGSRGENPYDTGSEAGKGTRGIGSGGPKQNRGLIPVSLMPGESKVCRRRPPKPSL